MKRTRPGPAKPVRGGLPPRRERPTGASLSRRKARAAANPAKSSRPLSASNRILFENMRQGAFFQRADGKLVAVNPAALAMFGLTRAEFLERIPEQPGWRFVREDGSPFPETEHPSMVALRTGQPVRNVVAGVFNARRNAHVWLEINAIPEFRKGEAKPCQVLVTLHDTTARKQAEHSLRLTQFAMDSAPDAVVWIRPDATYAYVNEAACRLLGYTREELLGKTVPEINPDMPLEQWQANWQRLKREQRLTYETALLAKDGRRVPVEATVNFLLFDGQEFICGFARDISRRRQAEAALREAHARLASIFDGTRDAIFIADAETGVVLDANREAARLVNRPLDSLVGLHQSQLHPPEEAERYRRQFGRRAGQSVPSHVEGEVCTSDGRRVPVEISASTIALTGGRRAMIGIFREITERKRVEQQVRQDVQRTEMLLELHQRAPQMTDHELYDYVLDKAVKLTDSAIGFFHQVSEDQNTIILTTWNQEALKNCTAAFENHYPLREAGNWVDCVRQQRPVVYNDFPHAPNQKGLPPGHTVLRRFMSIPVIEDGKVRIIFGVGNKAADYDDHDVAQLQLVANELHKIMAQRCAQDRLRLQALLLDQISDTVTATDLEGRITYANEAQARAIQCSKAELVGQMVEKYGDDSAHGVTQREIVAATRARGSWRGEVINYDANGRGFVVEVRTTLVRNAAGEPIGMCGVGTDITERKQAEEAVRASEERYRTLVECSPYCIHGIDLQGRLITMNPAGLRMMGVESEQAVCGKLYVKTVSDTDRPRIERLLDQARQGRASEFEFTATNGRQFHSSFVPIADREGRVLRIMGLTLDITERRRAEEALRASKSRLEAVFRVAPTGVGVVTNRVLQEVNQRILEMTGYTEAELIGASSRLLYPSEEDFAHVGHEKYRQIAERGTGTVETRWQRKNGGILDVLLSSTPLDPADYSRGVVFTALDITERKQAQEALRASEAKWRSYLENAPVGVLVADADGRHMEANREAEVMLGYEPGGLLGTHFRDLPAEESVESALRHFAEVAGGGCSDGQFQLRRKDGGRIWASVRASKIASDRFLAVIQDITERVRSEEAVRKLSRAVEQSPTSVIITDLQGNCEYVNHRFCELTGYTAAEVLGKNPRLLKSGQTPPETYRQLWEAITQGGEWDGEMLNRKKNGELFWERALISPIQDAQGRTTHYLGLKEDVTGRKRAEQELRASREQLRALASALSRAEQQERRRIATLLHDDVIQSLALTRIKLGALRAQLTTAEQQALLDSLRAHLEEAIGSARSMTFQLSPPILHELGLEAALGWLAEQFTRERGVHCEFVADAPRVSLDEETRNLLFTATRELLLNVVKHARATRARVATQNEGGTLRVIVEDDGQGFDLTSIPAPRGTSGGFGLFSIRERLSYLGGQCDLQSAPARGTRVVLTLPLKRTSSYPCD